MRETRAVVDSVLGEPLSIETVVLPDPDKREVLVRIVASGVCHSQIRHTRNGSAARPQLLGHEATGIVEEVGTAVTSVRPGDPVLLSWIPRDVDEGSPAGSITSRAIIRGRETRFRQVYTWAEHVLCHEQLVVPMSRGVRMDVTAIVGCAVVTGVGAVIGTARVPRGASIAVFGAGGVGINIVAGGVLAQASRIIAVDVSDEKLVLARSLGATDIVNARREDPVSAIRTLTDGGADYSFDAVGSSAVIGQCLESVRPGVIGGRGGGIAVAVGIPEDPIVIRPELFPVGERALLGSVGGSSQPSRDFPQYIEWFQAGSLPLDRMVTDRFAGLQGAVEALAALDEGRVLGRAIIEFDSDVPRPATLSGVEAGQDPR